MRRLFLLGALALLAGCPTPSPVVDGGTDAGPGVDGGPMVDAGTLRPCVERPGEVARPPGTAGLPCELLPPSFAQ